MNLNKRFTAEVLCSGLMFRRLFLSTASRRLFANAPYGACQVALLSKRTVLVEVSDSHIEYATLPHS